MGFEVRFEVDATVARATLAFVRQLPADMRKRVIAAIRDEARAIARDAKAALRAGRGGRGNLPAGAPPRSRSGALARSIRATRGRGGLFYLVEARELYGKFLETGTTHGGKRQTQTTTRIRTGRGGLAELFRRRHSVRIGGSQRMPPHPFITLALARRRAQSEKAIGDAIRAALEGAATAGTA